MAQRCTVVTYSRVWLGKTKHRIAAHPPRSPPPTRRRTSCRPPIINSNGKKKKKNLPTANAYYIYLPALKTNDPVGRRHRVQSGSSVRRHGRARLSRCSCVRAFRCVRRVRARRCVREYTGERATAAATANGSFQRRQMQSTSR